MDLKEYLERLLAASPRVDAARSVFAGAAAAHVHLASVTGWAPRKTPRYLALVPRTCQVVGTRAAEAALAAEGLDIDQSPVGDVVRPVVDRFATRVQIAGREVPVLSREAVLAELLGAGGFAVALAGLIVRRANEPPVDVDDVRDLLKAARQPERFQPMLELLDVA